MPRSHRPSKVSQAIAHRNGAKYSPPSNRHHCLKSPSGSHWWAVEPPTGVISDGTCRYCGECRKFANTLEASFNPEVDR